MTLSRDPVAPHWLGPRPIEIPLVQHYILAYRVGPDWVQTNQGLGTEHYDVTWLHDDGISLPLQSLVHSLVFPRIFLKSLQNMKEELMFRPCGWYCPAVGRAPCGHGCVCAPRPPGPGSRSGTRWCLVGFGSTPSRPTTHPTSWPRAGTTRSANTSQRKIEEHRDLKFDPITQIRIPQQHPKLLVRNSNSTTFLSHKLATSGCQG